MLKVNNLTVKTLKGRVLIDRFSFVLNDGDKIALIGEEGNGKSTLMKIMAKADIGSYATYEGTVVSDGVTAYMPQSVEDSLLDKSVVSYISGEDTDYVFLYSLLNGLGIDLSLLERENLRSLSGGERVKISLAKLLYARPDIILLDEPTNDLDLKTLIWLEEFILNSDKAIIFISHDETLLENCSNGILHLEQLKRKSEARITFSHTGYREYVSRREDMIKRVNSLARKERSEYDKQLEKWRQIYQKVDHAQKTISRGDPHGGQLLKKKMHAVKSAGHNLEVKKENLTAKYEPEEAIDIFFEGVDMNPGKVIIDLHLKELKAGGKLLSKNINLKVMGKDKICIIGDNGSGKSTLMKIMAEELLSRKDVNAGYMPQNYEDVMDYGLTPVAYLLKDGDNSYKTKIRNYLGALKFTTEEMEHRIGELSEGQKCKVLIAGMILKGCDVLLLDEPTRNLSPLSGPVIREILSDYQGCIIAVSHDRKFIEEVSNKVYMLNSEGLKAME